MRLCIESPAPCHVETPKLIVMPPIVASIAARSVSQNIAICARSWWRERRMNSSPP